MPTRPCSSLGGRGGGGPVVAALPVVRIILPGATVSERSALACRARARKRAPEGLVAGLSAERLTRPGWRSCWL